MILDTNDGNCKITGLPRPLTIAINNHSCFFGFQIFLFSYFTADGF